MELRLKSGLMAVVLCLSATAWAQVPATAMPVRGTVEQRTFFSAALQRDMPYEVVLPADYEDGQRRYAVLYLLHGWQGDETNWIKLTHLVELASHYPLIVVTPRGGNSWYVNSATRAGDRYADYITSDLVTEMDSHYRTIVETQGRAIAGLSMGGYGAVLLTLRHPEIFGFAASVSGAFAGSTNIAELMPSLKPSLKDAYGAEGSATRRENDVDRLIAAADPAKTPYLFLECGTADPLLGLSRHVTAELSARRFAYEYHELPGAHSWKFWDNSLPMMLDALVAKFHLSPTPPAGEHLSGLMSH